MKKTNLIIACSLLLGSLTACSGNESSTANGNTTNADSNNASSSNVNQANSTANNQSTPSSSTPAASKPALMGQDSAFVMKAAIGGMMEVESSNAALANASHERVKAFANMMVADHTQANNELKTYAAEHGMTLPAALPADKQQHIDAMKKMTGKAFDKHYIDMMVNDHKKDIGEFEKQAKSGKEQDLKDWAAKTLPTLQKHRDSVLAISKAKM